MCFTTFTRTAAIDVIFALNIDKVDVTFTDDSSGFIVRKDAKDEMYTR